MTGTKPMAQVPCRWRNPRHVPAGAVGSTAAPEPASRKAKVDPNIAPHHTTPIPVGIPNSVPANADSTVIGSRDTVAAA